MWSIILNVVLFVALVVAIFWGREAHALRGVDIATIQDGVRREYDARLAACQQEVSTATELAEHGARALAALSFARFAWAEHEAALAKMRRPGSRAAAAQTLRVAEGRLAELLGRPAAAPASGVRVVRTQREVANG